MIEKITKDRFLSIIQNSELLFKFYEELSYATCLLEHGCIHISTCEVFRNSNSPDCDELDGVVLKNISAGDMIIDDNLDYYRNNKEVFIKIDDKFYNHENRYLNNYIFCMSLNRTNINPMTFNELEECLKNHGKYVFVSNLSNFVTKLIKAKGKPCFLIAAAPIIYSDCEKVNIFTKRKKYSHEHEYRLVFDMENKHEASLNLSIGDLREFSNLYEII